MGRKEKNEKADLPNFHRINDNLYRGGEPSEQGIKALAEFGIKTIINFRDHKGNVRKERELCEKLGIKFMNLPLSNWFKAKDHEIDEILAELLKTENHPVFIHCKRGADRTGTVAAIYRMKYEGWNAKQANREAKKYGIGWWQVWMKDYIKKYYEKMDPQS